MDEQERIRRALRDAYLILDDAGAPEHVVDYYRDLMLGAGVEHRPLFTVELHNWCRSSRLAAKQDAHRAAELAARQLERAL